jgi:hypothetical protein
MLSRKSICHNKFPPHTSSETAQMEQMKIHLDLQCNLLTKVYWHHWRLKQYYSKQLLLQDRFGVQGQPALLKEAISRLSAPEALAVPWYCIWTRHFCSRLRQTTTTIYQAHSDGCSGQGAIWALPLARICQRTSINIAWCHGQDCCHVEWHQTSVLSMPLQRKSLPRPRMSRILTLQQQYPYTLSQTFLSVWTHGEHKWIHPFQGIEC